MQRRRNRRGHVAHVSELYACVETTGDIMQSLYLAAIQHARVCAALELCTTLAAFADLENSTESAAREALKSAARDGYFRPVLHRGTRAYQPAGKAGDRRKTTPKFLRSGLSDESIQRGLMRCRIVATRQDLAWLSASESAALCEKYGIQSRGFPRALVGLEGAHYHIFSTVLESEDPVRAVLTASGRWLHLLDSGSATLHLVAQAGEPSTALLDVLGSMTQAPLLRSRLEKLDAEMAADSTGAARLTMAGRRADLATRLTEEEGRYPWLGGVIEVHL